VDGVGHDVSDVTVDEGVHGVSTVAFGADQPGVPQDAKVLRDERLAHVQTIDQLPYDARSLVQFDDDGQTRRGGEHLEQSARRLVGLRRR